MNDLVIVGAGGFGRETADVVDAINAHQATWTLLGVVDDAPAAANVERLASRAIPHLGGLHDLPGRVSVAVAIGDPGTRRRIARRLATAGHRFPSLIHPSCVVGSQFDHGDGLIALGGVSIGTNVTLGDHVHLNGHAVLGHDTCLSDFVSVNPNATISGDVCIGEDVLVGAGSTVLNQLRVRRSATIGAGAVVVREVPEGRTVKGVPAQ